MSFFNVQAGDFPKGTATYTKKAFYFSGRGFFNTLLNKGQIPITDVDSIEVKSENKEFSAGKAIGAGALGAAILGPIGLFASALGKNNKALVSFRFKDGRKALIEISGSGLKDIIKDLEVANY